MPQGRGTNSEPKKKGSTLHLPQYKGGKKRPKGHSGQRKPVSFWKAEIQALKDQLTASPDAAPPLKLTQTQGCQASLAIDSEKEQQRIALQGRVEALESACAKHEQRLVEECELLDTKSRKIAELQGEIADLQVRNEQLTDKAVRLRLDVEWLSGLRHDGVPPTSRRRRRGQRQPSDDD